MKRTASILLLTTLLAILLGFFTETSAQRKGRRALLGEEEMKPFEQVSFTVDNFAKVERGMTQKQVLGLLGKPLKITKEHRRHNRWTVHYFYPEGHVVNFKDGLVVGKE